MAGKPFRDIVELKAILSKHQDEVARHLADRLLAYGTGRRSSGGAITGECNYRQTHNTDYRLRDLIEQVILSEHSLTSASGKSVTWVRCFGSRRLISESYQCPVSIPQSGHSSI